MSALVGLLGVLVGAVVTALVQLRLRQRERQERWLSDLLQSCAELYALESMFRHYSQKGDRTAGELRVGPVAADKEADRRGEGHAPDADDELVAAPDHLAVVGKESYRAARDRTAEYPDLIDRHQDALIRFAAASQRALRAEKSSKPLVVPGA